MAKKKKKKAQGNFMSDFIERMDNEVQGRRVPTTVLPPGWKIKEGCDDDENFSPDNLMFGPLVVDGEVNESWAHDAQQGEFDAPLFLVVWTEYEEGKAEIHSKDAETVAAANRIADRARAAGHERIRRFQIRGAWMENMRRMPWGQVVINDGPPGPSHVTASRTMALFCYEARKDVLPDEGRIACLRDAEVKFRGRRRDVMEKLVHADRLIKLWKQWEDATKGTDAGELWFKGEDGIPEEAASAAKRLLQSVIDDEKLKDDHPAKKCAQLRLNRFVRTPWEE